MSLTAFLSALPAPVRADCKTLDRMLARVVGEPAQIWGTAIVGYGRYRYPGPGGRIAEWPLTAFSPRKQNLTVYLMNGCEQHVRELARLGPHTTGKACLYVKGLAALDLAVLEKVVAASVADMRARYPL